MCWGGRGEGGRSKQGEGKMEGWREEEREGREGGTLRPHDLLNREEGRERGRDGGKEGRKGREVNFRVKVKRRTQ